MRTLSLAILTTGHLLAGALLAGPAFAQTSLAPLATTPTGAVGSTVTGGLPEKAGSTTAVGQTKPAGAPVGDGLGTRPDLQQKSRDIDRKIDTGICVGCK